MPLGIKVTSRYSEYQHHSKLGWEYKSNFHCDCVMGVYTVDVIVVPVTKPTCRKESVVVRTCTREPLHPFNAWILQVSVHGMDFTSVCKSVVTLVLVLGINDPYPTSPDFVTC